MTIITWFPQPSFPQRQIQNDHWLLCTSLNSSGVVWVSYIWCVCRVKLLRRNVEGTLHLFYLLYMEQFPCSLPKTSSVNSYHHERVSFKNWTNQNSKQKHELTCGKTHVCQTHRFFDFETKKQTKIQADLTTEVVYHLSGKPYRQRFGYMVSKNAWIGHILLT